MLGSIRKFSKTIYAKILLGIVVIPFVFWGMGSSFVGGNKNVIVVIDKEKYSVQEFTNFIQKYAPIDQKINANLIDKFLSDFIGEKLIEKEAERFDIKLSDKSLSKIIKGQKEFKRENKFSRIEYEKFLLTNNITAVNFENNLLKHEKKKQLLNLIAGGIAPSEFLISSVYNKMNQKRNIEIINLNDVLKKKLTFAENKIQSYFDTNKDFFKEMYKSVKFLELTPKKLTDNDDFNDLFFKSIDEIDDLIIQGKDLNYFIKKFNLEKAKLFTFNKYGKDKNSNVLEDFPEDLIKSVYDIDDSEPTVLIENKNKYFLIELVKTENIQRNIDNQSVKNEILLKLNENVKRKSLSMIIAKINQDSFKKYDFDKLSKNENVPIKKVRLENLNDNKILKEEIVNQIYMFSEKKIIVVHDINFSENYLIYIDKIENVSMNLDLPDYKKYLNLSKAKIQDDLYNTYNFYLKKRYEIDINQQTLNTVKNYFIY